MGSKIIGGGGVFYRDDPPFPLQIPSNTISTGWTEKSLRRWGVWLDRVRGFQPGIYGVSSRQAASEGSLLLMVEGSLGN